MADKWYNNTYYQLLLAFATCATVIIIWYNGEDIQEWSVTTVTSALAILLNILRKIFRKPGNPPAPSAQSSSITRRILRDSLPILNDEDEIIFDEDEESNSSTPKISSQQKELQDEITQERKVFQHHTSSDIPIASSSKKSLDIIESEAASLGYPESLTRDGLTYKKYHVKNDSSTFPTGFSDYFPEVKYELVTETILIEKNIQMQPFTPAPKAKNTNFKGSYLEAPHSFYLKREREKNTVAGSGAM